MSNMSEQYLDQVKIALNITGTYQDDTIAAYIDEVTAYLIDSGVKKENISSGIGARGVMDLWNYGSGEGRLSSYFMQRAAQLSCIQ